MAFILGAVSLPDSAGAFQIFTDRLAWEAALGGASITTDPFDNGIANGTSINFDSGVVSTGAPDSAVASNAVSGASQRFIGSVADGEDAAHYDTITWTFPVAIIGFGVDLIDAADGDGLTMTGNFDGTGDQTISVFDVLTPLGLSDGFLGVIGTATFSSIVLSDEDLSDLANEAFIADNLSFAAAQVPEPATLALFGAGLAGLGWLAGRRKRT